MCPTPLAERRQHPRRVSTAAVVLRHGPTDRHFPARCIDLSQGGALMHVGPSVPAAAGQAVLVTINSPDEPQLAGLSGMAIEGLIVRVDRQGLLRGGQVAIAVAFARH